MEKYTWGTLQLETIKKMFLNKDVLEIKDLKRMRTENRYKTYMDGMRQACNEAVGEIIKRGKPQIKTFDLTVQPIINLIYGPYAVFNKGNETLEYKTDEGLSYYFETDNKALVEIYVDGSLVKTIETRASKPGKFTAYRGYIDNEDKKPVTIAFKGNNPYYLRNLAIYGLDYDTGDGNVKNIPEFREYYKCDLSKYIKDFYKLEKLYLDGAELINNTNYVFEDRYNIILDRPGFYRLKYQAYPLWITEETMDDDEFNIDPEIAVIIPLYMASQLYKDDDISIATVYRNEFEVALENYYSEINDLKFVSKSGWL